jgi:hypothetical protein
MNKWNKLYCKYHPAVVKAKWVTGFLPHFQWWDDVQAELGALVKPNSLWFFHRLHLKREAFTLCALRVLYRFKLFILNDDKSIKPIMILGRNIKDSDKLERIHAHKTIGGKAGHQQTNAVRQP